MHLSGQLTDWSINDLLQIMQVTTKTGSLDIDGESRGRVHFKDGAVTGAELSGAAESAMSSDRAGVADVIYVLATLEEGTFSVGPADGPDSQGWSVEDVMADVAVLQSLEGEVIEAGLFEARAVRFAREIGKPITLEPQDWAEMVSLVQPFTFGQLEASMGRGAGVRLLHTLHRLGVAEPVAEDEDESQWLDRLADDIAPDSDEPTWIEQLPEEPVAAEEEKEEPAPLAEVEPLPEPVSSEPLSHDPEDLRGVAAPASTTLTDDVYDEIRRLRSKVAEK